VEKIIADALALAPLNPRPSAAAANDPPSGPPDPLTPREREIAALLARGWSNRLIAEELSISEHTVRTHVTAILGKLGMTGRAQVALWAVAQGLVAAPGAD
jgi:DNA-binding NarL/FixJ family response regulator